MVTQGPAPRLGNIKPSVGSWYLFPEHPLSPPHQIDSLTILDTAIPSLPRGAFSGWTILRLVLNRNTLSQVDQGAFEGVLLDSLVELDLSDNLLANIGAQVRGIFR